MALKVCLICDEYPPVSHGGIGSITKSLAEELVRQGNEVFIVGLLPVSYGGKSYEVVNGVEIWRIHHGIKIPFLSRRTFIYKLINKILKTDSFHINKKWLEQNRFIENLVKDKGIDVIEFPDFRFAFHYLDKIKAEDLWPRIKISKMVKFHGSINFINLELNKAIQAREFNYEKSLFEYATQFISVSDYAQQKMKEYYNLEKQIDVIPNGLEIVENKNVKRENFVVFSGSLVPIKGIVELIKAWNLICQQTKNITLKIYGKGVKQRFLKYISLEAKNRIQFMGHVPQNELIMEYSKAKLAVFPSLVETFGLAPIEAMMMGCPTIGGEIFAKLWYDKKINIKDLNLEGMLLVNPKNFKSLSEKIILLINDESLSETIGKNGKNFVKENFNIINVAKKHCTLYNKV